jgi:hypothetical protein
MDTTSTSALLSGLGRLSLVEVEKRITEIDAERAALSLLRRSLAARDRTRRRAAQRADLGRGADHG